MVFLRKNCLQFRNSSGKTVFYIVIPQEKTLFRINLKKTGVPLEKLSYYFPIKKLVVRKNVFRVTTTLACGRPPTASLQLFPGFLAPRAHLRLLVAADIKVFGGFRTI